MAIFSVMHFLNNPLMEISLFVASRAFVPVCFNLFPITAKY